MGGTDVPDAANAEYRRARAQLDATPPEAPAYQAVLGRFALAWYANLDRQDAHRRAAARHRKGR